MSRKVKMFRFYMIAEVSAGSMVSALNKLSESLISRKGVDFAEISNHEIFRIDKKKVESDNAT